MDLMVTGESSSEVSDRIKDILLQNLQKELMHFVPCMQMQYFGEDEIEDMK